MAVKGETEIGRRRESVGPHPAGGRWPGGRRDLGSRGRPLGTAGCAGSRGWIKNISCAIMGPVKALWGRWPRFNFPSYSLYSCHSIQEQFESNGGGRRGKLGGGPGSERLRQTARGLKHLIEHGDGIISMIRDRDGAAACTLMYARVSKVQHRPSAIIDNETVTIPYTVPMRRQGGRGQQESEREREALLQVLRGVRSRSLSYGRRRERACTCASNTKGGKSFCSFLRIGCR